ncbi:DUF6478 family protein [Shimia sp.]|uniref:DUF6478 family protein n=1 Tax=Shimia sp. TaxID=1954381 RepID=UPI0035615E4C
MGQGKTSLVQRLYQRAVARYWARSARSAATARLAVLRQQSQKAQDLRRHLNRVIAVSQSRLALPLIGSNSFPRPHGTDWAWRPELWRQPLDRVGIASVANRESLGAEVTLFHDCAVSEVTLRQIRNTREADLAPFGVSMDVLGFDGSFLSLVVDLPDEAVRGLKRSHVIRLDTIVEQESPLEIFVRLNVKHGPNTEQVVHELPVNQEVNTVEFDLAYTKLNEKRVEKAWVDLIFEGPEMNRVILRDATFSRRPRAEF